MNEETIKEQFKKETETLEICPFCGGDAEFVTNKSKQIMLQHHPKAGVICPARCECYCDTFDFGRKLWNQGAFEEEDKDEDIGTENS